MLWTPKEIHKEDIEEKPELVKIMVYVGLGNGKFMKIARYVFAKKVQEQSNDGTS